MKQFELNTVFELQSQDLFENLSLFGPPIEANGTAQIGALETTMDPRVLIYDFQFQFCFAVYKRKPYNNMLNCVRKGGLQGNF